MTETYYKILELDSNASLADIKKAYRQKAKVLHPDINKSLDAQEKFILLNEAYEYLQNVKTGKVYDNKASDFKKAKTADKNYEYWKRTQRAKARARAAYHARMKYEAFTKTNFYKASVALNVFADFLEILTVSFILIGIPIIGFTVQGFLGLLVSLIMIIVTLPYWIVSLIHIRQKFKFKEFISAIIWIVKAKAFIIIGCTIINLFILLRIGLSTLINIWYLVAIFAVLISLASFLTVKLKKTFIRKLLLYGLVPGIINLFFLANFLFDSNLTTETYNFKHKMQPTRYGSQKSTHIILEGNVYQNYVGIRVFLDIEQMENASKITYNIADGLFGLKVMKSYKFS